METLSKTQAHQVFPLHALQVFLTSWLRYQTDFRVWRWLLALAACGPRDSNLLTRCFVSRATTTQLPDFDNYYPPAFGGQCRCRLHVSWATPTETDLQGDFLALRRPTEMACQEVCPRQARGRRDRYLYRLKEQIPIPRVLYCWTPSCGLLTQTKELFLSFLIRKSRDETNALTISSCDGSSRCFRSRTATSTQDSPVFLYLVRGGISYACSP